LVWGTTRKQMERKGEPEQKKGQNGRSVAFQKTANNGHQEERKINLGKIGKSRIGWKAR